MTTTAAPSAASCMAMEREEIVRLLNGSTQAFGRLDILVNNAGVFEFLPIEAQTPLGRIGQPQDIGTVAALLASADAGWITGETFVVAGGFR